MGHLTEREFGFGTGRDIDDPQRRAIAAVRIPRQTRVEPIECPVEIRCIRPAESGDGFVVISAVPRYFAARWRKYWMIPEKSTPP
jgi:hypothetical protein